MNINSSKPPESQGPDRSAQNTQNLQKSTTAEQKEKTAPAKNAGSADRVDISGRSKEIADIMAAVNQLPDVRNDKVQAIKQSVDAGTYSVDAGKVASSIIKSI
jgi:negative regulator of flagellin synthesis FlgM